MVDETNFGEVKGLMRQLRELGVALPEELATASTQLGRIEQLLKRPNVPDQLLGLTDDEMADALHELALGFTVTAADGPARDAIRALSIALANAIVADLAPRADAILDQLRPAFDTAANLAHRATELGLNPASTDRDVLGLDDVAAARDAWAALPAAARTLTAIATARIGLSRVAGVAPAAAGIGGQYHRRESVHDLAPTMFRTDGRAWRSDFEDEWQLWLRLSAGTPARLLTLQESARAAEGIAA